MATQANTLTGALTGTIGNVVFPTTVFTPVQTAQATQTKVAQATVKISVRDVLQKERTAIKDGEKVYLLIKDALRKGHKVQLSFKDIRVYTRFFDEAICRLYGDFPEETVDNDVEILDLPKYHLPGLRETKKLRKTYYYNRPKFDELVRQTREYNLRHGYPVDDPEERHPDFVPDPGDPYAPGHYGRWINHKTGEEYFI